MGISLGGEGGIRTLGTIARTTVFETAPFDRSGTSPWGCVIGVPTQIRKR